MKAGRGKEEWLNAYQGFKKYLNQCVLCQEEGYDPIKIEKKEGLFFKQKAMEYFHPLLVDELGICSACAERLTQKSANP